MPRLSPENLFVKQNVWLKTAVLALGSVATIVVPVKGIIYLLPITVLYSFLSLAIYRHILKGIRLFLPFFTGYAVLASVFGTPFPDMIFFMLRILILIILMVIYSASLCLKRLMEDSHVIFTKQIFRPIAVYFIATLLFIKKLISHYKELQDKASANTKSISTLIPNLIDAIVTNWQLKDDIEAETEAILSCNYIKPNFLNKYNLVGCFYITFLILTLSI